MYWPAKKHLAVFAKEALIPAAFGRVGLFACPSYSAAFLGVALAAAEGLGKQEAVQALQVAP